MNYEGVNTIRFVLCLLGLLMVGCDNRHEATLPYVEEVGRIFLPVVIDGKKYDFVFDTGSNCSILNYLVAQSSGIRPTEKSRVNMWTENAQFNDTVYFSTNDLFIGGVKFKQTSLRLDHYSRSFGLAQILGEDYGGVLGETEIKTKNWLFDLKARTVTVSDKEIGESRIKSPLSLCLDINPDSTKTYVDVLLNDSVKKSFLFDTGWVSGANLDYKGENYFMQMGIIVPYSLFKTLNPITPIKGNLQFISMMKINDLKLDTLSIEMTEGAFALSYPEVPVIGTSFLRNFDYVLYDTYNRQIRFYGYRANNQGEKDFLKALKQK